MIRRLIALIGAALMSVCLFSCTMTEIPEKEVVCKVKVPPKMMFLGDSIAAGYGLEGYTDSDNSKCRSYPNILKERYEEELGGECGHTMINNAVSGYTSDDLIAQLRSGALDDQLGDCDAVVVSIGGNDLLDIMLQLMKNMGITEKGAFDKGEIDIFSAASAFMSMSGDIEDALEHFNDNIKVISDELSSRTDGAIFIQTLYDPLEYFSQFTMVTDYSKEKIGKLNTIIYENASGRYNVIGVAEDFKGKAGELTRIGDFDIHPNAAGHEAIAEDVDRALRAEGFTYTTTVRGEKQLTADGKKVIAGGITGGAVFIAAVVSAVIVSAKKKKSKKQ